MLFQKFISKVLTRTERNPTVSVQRRLAKRHKRGGKNRRYETIRGRKKKKKKEEEKTWTTQTWSYEVEEFHKTRIDVESEREENVTQGRTLATRRPPENVGHQNRVQSREKERERERRMSAQRRVESKRHRR